MITVKASRNTKRERMLQDKRIERLYYKNCSGVQVSILDIPKVFDAGFKAIAADPAITDEALGAAIVAFVNTIRKN